MTFHEKLQRLGGDRNKSEVSRRAGLSPTAYSSYLAKRGTIPRGDIALRLARALRVDLEWLLDDRQGWPPKWVNYAEHAELAAPAA